MITHGLFDLPYLAQRHKGFAWDPFTQYANNAVLHSLNRGRNWKGPYVASSTLGIKSWDTYESYTVSSNLHNQAGGYVWGSGLLFDGAIEQPWADVYKIKNLQPMFANDDFDDYTTDADLAGLNGSNPDGLGQTTSFNGAYVKSYNDFIKAYDTFNYTDGASLDSLNGSDNTIPGHSASNWGGAYYVKNTWKPELVYSTDSTIALNNSSSTQSLSCGSTWNRLRVCAIAKMTAGSNFGGNGYFKFGLSNSNGDHLVKLHFGNAIWYARQASSYAYYMVLDNYIWSLKNGTSTTHQGPYANTSYPGCIMFPADDQDDSLRRFLVFDITKSSTNYLVRINLNFSGNASAVHITPERLDEIAYARNAYQFYMGESPVADAYHYYPNNVTIAQSAVNTDYSNFYASFDRTQTTVNLYNVRVTKFS